MTEAPQQVAGIQLTLVGIVVILASGGTDQILAGGVLISAIGTLLTFGALLHSE